MREGEVFLLGASSWRADEITRDRVIVTPAAGEPGKMPFWHGDRPGRPRAFGEAIGALTRRLARANDIEALRLLEDDLRLGPSAAKNLLAYVRRPTAGDRRGPERPGDRRRALPRRSRRLAGLHPLPLRRARARPLGHGGARGSYRDATRAKRRHLVRRRNRLPHPRERRAPRRRSVLPAAPPTSSASSRSRSVDTSLFAARFRESAARALLLPRQPPGKRTPLWAQRKRAHDLLAVASQLPVVPDRPRDVPRVPARRLRPARRSSLVLQRIEAREDPRDHRATRAPPPRSRRRSSSRFVANFIYDGDAPLAERRAQALTIDHAQLRELLGETELRELLDPDAIAAHVRLLQRVDRPAKHADGVHDLLLSLGDLSEREIEARARRRRGRLDAVARGGRAHRARQDRRRGAARRERRRSARYSDALGVAVPRGIAGGLPRARERRSGGSRPSLGAHARALHPERALRSVRGRGRRRASRSSIASSPTGRSSRGRSSATARGASCARRTCCKPYERKSLAKLRREIEPVDAAAYGRFVLEWQAVANRRRGKDALLETVAQLQGCPLAASALDREDPPGARRRFPPLGPRRALRRGAGDVGRDRDARTERRADHALPRRGRAAPRATVDGRRRGGRGEGARGAREARGDFLFGDRARRRGLSDRDARCALAPGLVGRGDERHARAAPEPCGGGERAETSGTRRTKRTREESAPAASLVDRRGGPRGGARYRGALVAAASASRRAPLGHGASRGARARSPRALRRPHARGGARGGD